MEVTISGEKFKRLFDIAYDNTVERLNNNTKHITIDDEIRRMKAYHKDLEFIESIRRDYIDGRLQNRN